MVSIFQNTVMGMKERKKIALECLGCKLNQAETEHLSRQLAAAGCEIVSSVEEADIYVLNTCTVTHIADRKSRHLLRQALRRNPDIRTVATGCYAEGAPAELSRIAGVSLVLDNAQKPHLMSKLVETGYLATASVPPQAAGANNRRTRSFLKVQDGCNGSCAYCAVPRVRRNENSVPAETIIDEVKQRVAEGTGEVVLTGTEIGRYHNGRCNLAELVRSILENTDVARLRLSSLQPQEISADFLELWQDPRLCPHFHLSLQSGSDTVLDRMKRRYTTADYRRVTSLVRERLPEAAVTTDVITGFPGETEEEFREGLDFCRRMEFARVHVFAYSPRPGTEAARMPGQVPASVKKRRSREMLMLAAECVRNFSQRFLGETRPVLWEKAEKGLWSGHTDNYIKVYARSDDNLTGRILPARLESLWEEGVWGAISAASASPPGF